MDKGCKIKGFKTCPFWLKLAYRRAVKYICQRCDKHEDIVGKLIPHRIIRGNKGGLYTVVPLNHKDNNVKIVCLGCHKLYHMNDNRRIKSF